MRTIGFVVVGTGVLLVLWGAARSVGPAVVEGQAAAPSDVPDPTGAGAELPDGYRLVTGRDRIRPIYAPTFVPADASPWPDDTLVLGVAVGGEAKAYPINVLNRREMVIDVIGDLPVLASW